MSVSDFRLQLEWPVLFVGDSGMRALLAAGWRMGGILDAQLPLHPTGKSAKTCPAPYEKIFRLTRRANQRYQLAPSFSRQEGRSRVVTNAGGDAMDAAASARNGVAGRVSRERSTGAQDGRRFQRTAKPCGPDTRCWCQAVGGDLDPTGSEQPLSRERR